MGVARIELAMPAMSRQRFASNFSFEIKRVGIEFGVTAQNLHNSPTVEFPSDFASSWMTALESSDSRCSYLFLP